MSFLILSLGNETSDRGGQIVCNYLLRAEAFEGILLTCTGGALYLAQETSKESPLRFNLC